MLKAPLPRKDFQLMDWIVIATVCVLVIILLGACGNLRVIEQVDREASTIFRHDLKVEVNGRAYAGVGVAPVAGEYKVRVFPEGKIDRIIWQTCHQETVVDKPSRDFWDVITKDHSYTFRLKPATGLEDISACALEITVLEEKKRRNGFAVIDFEDKRQEVQLPAKIKCNGQAIAAKGVSMCQASAGLVQEIEFSEPVVQSGARGACDVMRSEDRKHFRFHVPKGKCTYYFVAQRRAPNGLRLLHRLNLIGYNDVPPVQ